MKDDALWLIVVLGIIAIGLFGGFKKAKNGGLLVVNSANQETTSSGQAGADRLKAEVAAEEAKVQSPYKDMVTLSSISRSSDPTREYVTIHMNSDTKQNIQVTGWTLKSLNTGVGVTIPKGTYLFFTGMANTEDNIILTPGDTLYLVTGISPNGASFKVNKCSGYLTQFQTFIPNLSTNCPVPQKENLNYIPKTSNNDACLDYIDGMSQCRIQTETLPANWSYECTNFIYSKINYPSCVTEHKSDNDFYQKEWRVYLKRSSTLWKTEREAVVLYDNTGKVVDTLQY
jgi:hypothetical protein